MSFLTELLAFCIVGDARYGLDDRNVMCPRCNWKGWDDETANYCCPRCKTLTKIKN